MNIINAKEQFLLKKLFESSPEEIYDSYLSVTEKNGEPVCEKSISLLKLFVQQHGDVCEGIIRTKKNDRLSLQPWGNGYLHLLTLISAYHLDRKEFSTGLLWAKKAIDLVGYFAPEMKKEMERDVISNMSAASFIYEHHQHFNEAHYDKFFLDWEIEGFYYCGNKRHFNDN